MAYTTPTTRATSYLVTAADWNTDIVDNIKAIWVGDGAGQMDYYTGATSKAKIAAGVPGNVLMVNGSSVPSFTGTVPLVLNHVTQLVDLTTDAETTIWTYTLTGGTLGTTGACHVKALILCGHTSDSYTETIKCYYGATAITPVNFTDAYGQLSLCLDFDIMATGATNTQRLCAFPVGRGSLSVVPGIPTLVTGTAAIDSTTDQVIKITHAGNNEHFYCYYTLLTNLAAV